MSKSKSFPLRNIRVKGAGGILINSPRNKYKHVHSLSQVSDLNSLRYNYMSRHSPSSSVLQATDLQSSPVRVYSYRRDSQRVHAVDTHEETGRSQTPPTVGVRLEVSCAQ